MSAVLRAAHYCAIAHPRSFNRDRARELTKAALQEYDSLMLEIEALRRELKNAPRFQGMTDLA